jgi:hypothetical protein
MLLAFAASFILVLLLSIGNDVKTYTRPLGSIIYRG